MCRAAVLSTLLLACSGEGSKSIDAGLDAPRRLAVTVDGPSAVAGTRSVKVTISVTNSTRTDSFPVGGLPATVDLAAPIQLSDWTLTVDGLDMSGTLLGRGMLTIPSGTSATTVTLTPI